MPDSQNKLSQFWLELKRRKVWRVVAVYAAVAFVVLQLVEILAPSLRLPEWTMNFMLVLLIVGFIIAVILSWIYDIHPEGGIVKTEPAHKLKEDEKPTSSRSWRIASYVSFVVIVGLIVLNVIPRSSRSDINEILDKSVAVLPFKCLSEDPEKQYLADGVMDAILLHLSRIEDIRVMSRTSVEQYRVTDKTVTEICKELDVAFLLEGSFRKYGDQARLIVQLIQPGKEDHAWASQYDREWKDIFAVESEVAQSIAKELQAVITPEEKQRIEKIPTTNLTAYDFYQRGRAEYEAYRFGNAGKEVLDRAEDLYYKALEYDSAFALAYTGLAQVYRNKHYWDTYLSEDFLDTMLILADMALSFNDQLAEAYLIRGDYYRLNNRKEPAISEYDKVIRFNPDSWEAYRGKYLIYNQDDLLLTIENLHKAISLYRGPNLSGLFRNLCFEYHNAGFTGKAEYYLKEALELDGDSASYYLQLEGIEESKCNFEKAIELGKKSIALDSTIWWVFYRLGIVHSFLDQSEESLEYFKKYENKIKVLNRPHYIGMFWLGHAYWMNGFKEEAESNFNKGFESFMEVLELDRLPSYDFFTFFTLAGAYAFLGDKDKAYENLRIMNRESKFPYSMIKDINNEPMFDSIRDEPEFRQIVRDVEAKYQAEHERVRQWLEENDML